MSIFQFTPLREGRLLAFYSLDLQMYFNSRPSARGDYFITSARWSAERISIHAPPRGATGTATPEKRALDFNFNSRPSARGD